MGITPDILKILAGMATTYAAWITRSVIKAEVEIDQLYGLVREIKSGKPGQTRKRYVKIKKILLIGRRKRPQVAADVNKTQGKDMS